MEKSLDPRPARQPLTIHVGLMIGVTAVSFAAVLIRLADAAPLAVAAYRTFLAAIVLVPIALLIHSKELLLIRRRTLCLLFGSALCLALHFGFWIASLDHTTVSSSVVIVTANPILVALIAHVTIQESVTKKTIIGISLGLLGGMVIALGDWNFGGSRLYGDGLALLGALAVAGYYVIGRKLVPQLSLLVYLAPVYGLSALILLLMSIITTTRLSGFSTETYFYMILIAIIPQLIGHSSLNWSLRHLPATSVGIAVMAEPIGATILAWLVLGEIPAVSTLVGGVLILAGVHQALKSN
jgi:drug/metabolite transporter (DMT)-like permease